MEPEPEKDKVIRSLEDTEEAAPGLPFYIGLPLLTPEEIKEVIKNMGDGTAQGGDDN